LRKVVLQDWKRIDYRKAWDKQTEIQKDLISYKRGQWDEDNTPEHHFVFCEHNPVYTLGKSGSMDHLLLSQIELEQQSISFYKINRG